MPMQVPEGRTRLNLVVGLDTRKTLRVRSALDDVTMTVVLEAAIVYFDGLDDAVRELAYRI